LSRAAAVALDVAIGLSTQRLINVAGGVEQATMTKCISVLIVETYRAIDP
jgi:hypothetical protein